MSLIFSVKDTQRGFSGNQDGIPHRKIFSLCWPVSILIKLCHRVPYEEPSNAEEGNTEEQCDGVDVEEAVKDEPVNVSIHFICSLFEGLPAQGGQVGLDPHHLLRLLHREQEKLEADAAGDELRNSTF